MASANLGMNDAVSFHLCPGVIAQWPPGKYAARYEGRLKICPVIQNNGFERRCAGRCAVASTMPTHHCIAELW